MKYNVLLRNNLVHECVRGVNAALSGEQRRPLHLKYCAVNTKVEADQKCRALRIRLECFVSILLQQH